MQKESVKKYLKSHFSTVEKNREKFIPGKTKIPVAVPAFGWEEVYEALDSMLEIKTTMSKKVEMFEIIGIKLSMILNLVASPQKAQRIFCSTTYSNKERKQ